MALIKCPECGKKISDKASVCVHCGHTINSRQTAPSANKARCPKCGSTDISSEMKAWSIKTGLLGTGDIINRCEDCGYRWKP